MNGLFPLLLVWILLEKSRPGESWFYRVEKENEGILKIVGLNDIITTYDKQVFSPIIIKIYIEGFVHELFSGNLGWID